MYHYNFQPYSVGGAFLRGTGRREMVNELAEKPHYL